MLPGILFLLLISTQVILIQSSNTNSSKNPVPPPGDPSWVLGLNLYKSIRSDSNSVNTLFSPLLVASSLGALSEGSAGKTAKQIQELLLSSSESPTEVGDLLSGALQSFTEANGTSFQLHASSAVFTKQTAAFSQTFQKKSQTRFGLLRQMFGKGDSKADLKQLSDWVKNSLRGVPAAALKAEIKTKAGALILGNALHFKGLWEREFSVETADRRIFLGTKYTKVVMMHRAGLYRFHEDTDNMVQVLEAPLWGGKASAVLLLPFHVESLARLDKLLTLKQLTKWLEKTSVSSVAISVPRANITSTHSLQKPLSSLGLTDVWDQKLADFSGVSEKSKGKLYLADVLHWASMELAPQAGSKEAELDEENIAVPKLFYADHPFIFFIRDNTTGALLLIGALEHVEGEAFHDEL